MNESLQGFARKELINGLKQCTREQALLFKRMYASKNSNQTIKEVVAAMPEAKLDWAMKQVARTIKNNEEKE